jgi:serine/threonine-protein kinase
MNNPVPATPPSPNAPKTAPRPDLTGRTLDDFHLLRRLGEGGMGQVYLAEQISLKRKVALKILRPDVAPDANALKRFRAEAEAVARATHANIVQVYAIGESDGISYMALEYVEGRNLREFLARKGPPDVPLALTIMRQVASALQRAGELGIIHRDIKPENILLTRKGEVKVADFGLSRCLGGDRPLNLTQSGVTMGTPLYMSPEQVEGRTLDPRTDIYSFGVTCYHLLAGRPPFRGDTPFEVAYQHVKAEPESLAQLRPDLPPGLCAIVHKMMAKDLTQRYATGRDLLRDLARLRESLSGTNPVPVSGMPSPQSPPGLQAAAAETALLKTSRPRLWLPIAIGLSLVLALAGGAVFGWVKRQRAEALPPATSAEADLGEADPVPLSPRKHAIALEKVVKEYLDPANGFREPPKFGNCLDLGLIYLDQGRWDEADKYFQRLDALNQYPKFRNLGRMGRAIVLALKSQPEQSNKLFKSLQPFFLPRGKKPWTEVPKGQDPDLRRMWQMPRVLFWLSQAARYNSANGPEADLPPWLLEFRDPPARP